MLSAAFDGFCATSANADATATLKATATPALIQNASHANPIKVGDLPILKHRNWFLPSRR
jgi:hypothetical protein